MRLVTLRVFDDVRASWRRAEANRLTALASQHLIVEQNMLAKLDMGARSPNPARPLAERQTSIDGVSLADLT
jgi:hypothetical protein